MRRSILILAALALTANVAAANPLHSFFDYHEPEAPVGGDCPAIASVIGAEATWYGEFSGNKINEFNGSSYPVSARGCFRTETECHIWQNVGITYLGRGALVATSCRRGAWRG